jgi:Phosphate-induced protein 1 conserved region.
MSSTPLGIRRSTYALAAAAAFTLTACSDTATTSPSKAIAPGSAALDQSPEFNDPSGHGHVLHTKQWFASQAPSDNAKPGGGGSNTGIFYHGGPVLRSGTNVAAVYWAAAPIYNGGPSAGTSGAGSADASVVGYFLNHLGGSSYFNINSTYTDGSGAHIVNAVNYTQYWANNSGVPTDGQSVSDAQMVAMLQTGFTSGALTYDPNTLYAIFTAGTVNLGGGFGTQYCAYHTHGTVTVNGVSKTVLYAAMPYDAAYPGACSNGTASPNGDVGADAEVNTLAHETEETTTDMMGTAWFDRRGYENADKCAWNFGTTSTASNGGVYNIQVGTKNFLVQQNWLNSGTGGCALKYP